MSGGVDSSVAAYLLKKDGYKVIGITMKLIDDEKTKQSIKDAREVCNILGIEHYVVDLQKEFKDIVINNFLESYQEGITPNPCVICNKFFKFGLFYEKAKALGCDYIATGHYAKVKDGKLYRADVVEKDQSYFLYGIDKNILNNIIFPLQGYEDKSEIREIANQINLNVKDKKDSQEVCFVPNDDYKSYLNNNLDDLPIPGDICLENGTILGKHNGLMYYTIGQRKGLGISNPVPLFVLGFNKEKNEVIVGEEKELYKKEILVEDINLLLVDEINDWMEVEVKTRYTSKVAKAKIIQEDKQIRVIFDEPQRAITPGQSAVFYVDDIVLGGGKIK